MGHINGYFMRQFLGVIFCFFLSGCGERYTTPPSLEYVVYPGANTLSLTELIDSIEVVRLQHFDTLIINRNQRLVQRDSSFYLIDIQGNKNVYRFARDGRFLNKIGTEGKGPEEYANIYDIIVEEEGDNVYIESWPYTTHTNYSKAGAFKGKATSEIIGGGSCQSGDTRWIIAGFNKEYLPLYLLKTDTSLTITDSIALAANAQNRYPYPLNTFSTSGDISYFWQICHPLVYKLDSNSVEPRLFIDFGDKYVTYADICQTTYSGDKKTTSESVRQVCEEIKKKKKTIIYNYTENDSHALIEISSELKELKEYRMVYGIKDKQHNQWHWIERLVTQENPYSPNWYFGKIRGFAKDGRLMCFLFGTELQEQFTDEARKLVSNPEALENLKPEIDMFILLCRLKKTKG